MENAVKALELLVQAGLPQFELGQDGYPLPGKVVKYYREQMKYIDREGMEKHWTQANLAQVLGLKETMVNLMENRNQGLDSIERRRTLSTILKIPPVLLGLGSLDAVVEIVTGQSTVQKTDDTKQIVITAYDVERYKKTFKAYNSLFVQGISFSSVKALENTTSKLQSNLQNVSGELKKKLLRVLWDFELLCAKVYGSDFTNWQRSFEHIGNIIELAVELDDNDLQAISLYTSGLYHLRQNRVGLAKIDIDGALYYAKGSLLPTKGTIFTLSSWYHQKTGDMFMAQKFYEEAEKHIRVKSDMTPIKFGKGTYLIGKGELLLHMNRPTKALEYLDDAERYISSSQKRLLVYLDIVRAKCYMEMKKPEYEQATSILRSALADNKRMVVARNMSHIEKLYQKLTGSTYGNSPDVVELGHEVQELKL